MSIYTDILKQAREKIESGEQQHICLAIGYFGPLRIKRKKLRNWISHLLDGHASYEWWLSDKHYKKRCSMDGDDIRDARLQWLDWMIENVDQEISK